MNPILERIIQTGMTETPDGPPIPLHSQVATEEGEFLQQVITRIRPKTSLEIGLALGVSALYICEALREVGAERHWVIDPHQYGIADELVGETPTQLSAGWRGIGMFNLQQAGFGDLVELRNQASDQALPKMDAEGIKVDFAFIDGWHTFDYALLDFFYVDRMLRVGGVVVFDDTLYPAVRKVCRYVATNRRYSVLDGPTFQPVTPPRVAHKVFYSLAGLRPFRRIVKPRFSEPDHTIGLPHRNFIAFRKDGEDLLGTNAGARRWDFHHDF